MATSWAGLLLPDAAETSTKMLTTSWHTDATWAAAPSGKKGQSRLHSPISTSTLETF